MKIFLQVNSEHLHLKHDFYGDYALEVMLLAMLDIYYGREISNQVRTILKSRIAEEELNKNLNLLAIGAHKIKTGRY